MPVKEVTDNREDDFSTKGDNYYNCLNYCDIHTHAGLDSLPSLHSPTPFQTFLNDRAKLQWFVMRDLKRSNAKVPAYKLLTEKGIEVFTPMKWQLTLKSGKRVREEVPYLHDLLFAHSSRLELEPHLRKMPTLQFRYFKGGGYCEPMVVREDIMNRFIKAVRSTEQPFYYRPDELSPDMIGRRVRIVGGPLNNYEGALLKIRGMRKKRLIVYLPTLLAAGVEVNPEFICFI